MVIYLEKMMERLNSGDQKVIFGTNLSTLNNGGMNNRQTVFFLLVDPMDKEHKDPETIDLEAPRLAQYMDKAWKRHQDAVYWVDINLAIRKGLKFYQP